MTYLNYKPTNGTTETVDEINPNDFKSIKEFNAEKRRLIEEYRLAGIPVYPSKRYCKHWK